MPERAAPATRLGEAGLAEVDRKWEFTIGNGLIPTWLINGKTFDPSRSDAFPKLGTTETWELHNRTKVAHLMHMHHTDWYMLSAQRQAPAGRTSAA